jgi:endogenous inhibitor of DNA gyrase (YacG/DUF329 family)
LTKPTIQERLRERLCPNCGGPVSRRSARGPAPKFCSNKCKRDLNNRLLVEGAAVIGLLKAWRVDRGSGEIAKNCFAQAVTILDTFNAEDLKAGRPRADYYGATLLGWQGTNRYEDRRRQRPTIEDRIADEAGPELADEAVEAARAAMDADPNMAF